MKSVAVLLSTYNGEKYIEELIRSVLNQEDVNVNLYIRDDGSTDKTREILNKFCNFSNVYIYYGENIYLTKSFLELLKKVNEEDYIAFCDQDDIWKKNKLSKAIEYIDGYFCKPALYFSSVDLINKDSKLLNKRVELNKVYSFKESLAYNRVIGCTMVFNRKLLDNIKYDFNGYIRMHDHWIYLICAALDGYIYCDKDSYIYYRQHENNEVGAYFNFIKHLKYNLNKNQYRCRTKQASNLLNLYNNEMNEERNKELFIFAHANDNLRAKLRFFKMYKNIYSENLNNILMTIMVLAGAY